jgi:hypothetical protein
MWRVEKVLRLEDKKLINFFIKGKNTRQKKNLFFLVQIKTRQFKKNTTKDGFTNTRKNTSKDGFNMCQVNLI